MKGRINIYRNSSPSKDGAMRIDLYDESSGVRFLVVDLSLEATMLALTGRGDVDCDFELHAEHVGDISEHKEIILVIPSDYSKEKREEFVRRYEVDGWYAHMEDVHNHHNWKYYKDLDCNNIKVTFHRFVKPS